MALIFPDLAPKERAKRYRALAQEAHRVVLGCTGVAREPWTFVERQWEHLAHKADVDALAELHNTAITNPT
jgi:hypothetical protein